MLAKTFLARAVKDGDKSLADSIPLLKEGIKIYEALVKARPEAPENDGLTADDRVELLTDMIAEEMLLGRDPIGEMRHKKSASSPPAASAKENAWLFEGTLEPFGRTQPKPDTQPKNWLEGLPLVGSFFRARREAAERRELEAAERQGLSYARREALPLSMPRNLASCAVSHDKLARSASLAGRTSAGGGGISPPARDSFEKQRVRQRCASVGSIPAAWSCFSLTNCKVGSWPS